ncbi:hypothetical protein ACSAZK_00385 [Methanosarcina sp. Mfa9]|uniref:hypothetical protein n=1 Tax=Methanosarcina sp. Mfa9 TaxID=3439063 RepID=UPI003F84C741
MKKLGILVAAVLIAAMLFASGCAEEPPEEGVEEEVPEEEVVVEEEEVPEEEVVVEEEEVVEEEIPEEAVGVEGEYSPVINPEDFVEEIDNPYFPLVPGTTFVYEGESDEGDPLRTEVYVTDETRVVMGVTTIVVRESEYEDDELEEETFDWYAQDKDGNVWYFGEESKEYDEGEVVSTAGSWEAGVDGAQPGIIMPGDPQVGDIYYQEFYLGEAEDQAEVVSLTESVTVPYGSFEDVLKTREWNPLEPGQEENKYYTSGVGLLLEEEVEGGDERLELVEISTE